MILLPRDRVEPRPVWPQSSMSFSFADARMRTKLSRMPQQKEIFRSGGCEAVSRGLLMFRDGYSNPISVCPALIDVKRHNMVISKAKHLAPAVVFEFSTLHDPAELHTSIGGARERQSPDWRFSARQSGDWRCRDSQNETQSAYLSNIM